MGQIYINSIADNPSLCDGPGYRFLLFLQGCDIHCNGCQNPSTWDMNESTAIDIKELSKLLRSKCFNKKLTITGGEPLMQKDALLELLEELRDFDLCLYTGHELNDVPHEILSYLKYVKTGPFIQELKTTTKPFIGSDNQKFIEVIKIETTK